MSIPSPIYIYRIIHLDNLSFILNQGQITCPNHPNTDPNYIGIGDSSLIKYRNEMEIPHPPYGTFRDYVSFYFGIRSPMLYNIKNGFLGVTKRPQKDIIYLISSYERIVERNIQYIFFDGHGYHHLSQSFNTDHGLQYIDWDLVNAKQWFDTEYDPDRKRRKQAEFLAYRSVPFEDILGIATYNENSKGMVENILKLNNKNIKMLALPEWYY